MILCVNGIPAPKGSARAIKRGGFAVLVASSSDANKRAQKSWSDAVTWAAKAARQGEAPMAGPVGVRIAFYLPRPKSVRRRWPTVAPDLDKLIRCTFDALTGVVWADDAQVIAVEPMAPGAYMKNYADDGKKPGALIEVYELPADRAGEEQRAMSVYESFRSIAAALIAFAAGRCRRHVEIDGHVIDLVHARDRRVVAPEEPTVNVVSLANVDRAAWDRDVASNVAAALSAGLALPPLATPEVPADPKAAPRPKPGPLCPCCLRPEDPAP